MISRVISTPNGVAPIITLLITYLLSPLPLQVEGLANGSLAGTTGCTGCSRAFHTFRVYGSLACTHKAFITFMLVCFSLIFARILGTLRFLLFFVVSYLDGHGT